MRRGNVLRDETPNIPEVPGPVPDEEGTIDSSLLSFSLVSINPRHGIGQGRGSGNGEIDMPDTRFFHRSN
jgi:hypothetical protein